MQRCTNVPKPQHFEVRKGIAVIKSMAIPFRNHAHRLALRRLPSVQVDRVG